MRFAVNAAALRLTGDAVCSAEVVQKLQSAPEAYGVPRGLATFRFLCGEIEEEAEWAVSLDQRDPGTPELLACTPFNSSEHF